MHPETPIMADIGTEAGLTNEQSAPDAASKLFIYLWNEAWQSADKTVEGDADALHDMRVALRRLRTALQNFEGDKNKPLLSSGVRRELKDWRTKIGKLGDKLGAVRDFDVLGDYVRDFDKTVSPGLREVEEVLQHQRKKNFAPMTRKIGRAGEADALREGFARWALGLPGLYSLSQIQLEPLAKRVLHQRIEESVALGSSLQNGDEEAQHELRRTLRRLRYTLETFAPCFDKPIKKPVKQLVELQDLLGEMQDCTVLQEWLDKSFGKGAPEDVEAFVEHGNKRREELLEEVRVLWTKREEGGLWEGLSSLAERN